MRTTLPVIILGLWAIQVAIFPVKAVEPILEVNSPAKFVYLIDAESDALLMSKNAEERMYPASMTKIMTVFIAFEQLKEGTISLDDEVYVSEKAHKMGGSRMFIEQNKTVALRDILRGIVVQSGNDASVALAEFLAGDESNFADLMNRWAEKLGMTGTHFSNASGWPDEQHYTTAKDLATLSKHLIKNHPDLYKMFSEKTFTFSKITQKNRNSLLGTGGIDGIKTGHTEASGYGMASSAMLNGRRLILVVNGLNSGQKRINESRRLLNSGFRATATKTLFKAGETVTTLPLWYGTKNLLPVVPESEVRLTNKAKVFHDITITASFVEPLRAPIASGEKVGQLHIHTTDKVLHSVDLLSAEDIESKGYIERFLSNIHYLLWGQTP